MFVKHEGHSGFYRHWKIKHENLPSQDDALDVKLELELEKAPRLDLEKETRESIMRVYQDDIKLIHFIITQFRKTE